MTFTSSHIFDLHIVACGAGCVECSSPTQCDVCTAGTTWTENACVGKFTKEGVGERGRRCRWERRSGGVGRVA